MGDVMRYDDAPHTDGEGWSAVVKAIDNMRDEIGQRHTENTTSLEVVQKELKIVIDRVDDLAKGFPDGDWDGHRRYHEVVIRKMEARTKFYEDLRMKLLDRGIWALLAFVGAAVLYYVKSKFVR